MTDPARLSQLADIVPRFNQHVQPGDEVLMGIQGDALFPYADATRPRMTVKSVDRSQSDPSSVELVLSDQTGREVVVPRNNIDASKLWEFSDDSFNNVVERAVSASASAQATGSRSSASASERSIEARMDEMDAFKKKVVMTLNEMAKEVRKAKNGEECTFCTLFNETYDAARKEWSDASSESSYSSDSSSSSESSLSSASSSLTSSSDGSDFAADLLMR